MTKQSAAGILKFLLFFISQNENIFRVQNGTVFTFLQRKCWGVILRARLYWTTKAVYAQLFL